MFAELTAQQTGIVTANGYRDPRMWGDRYREFEVGAVGTGVAIGDYDGDGKPDIFVVSKTESCRLFRNRGNWQFEDVTEKAGVGDKGDAAMIWKQGATFVDVNNDGLLDIYVCRFGAPNLLYINQGDGTFKEEAAKRGLAVNDASVMAAFCDYDRDGWLDVFIQTNLLNGTEHPNGQRDYLFHNNGDGTFTDVSNRAGISSEEAQGHSATWWDFNGDGWPDLYVANDFSAPDKLYRNNKDGTFTDVINEVVPHMPFSSMGSDLGDVNNDGLIDFFASEMASSTHEKDQRSMASVRAFATDLPDNSAAVPQLFRNAVYLNTGTGRCLEAAFLLGLAATDWTWAPRLEDLDNDGRLDLFITNGTHRELTNVDQIQRTMMAETIADKVRIRRTSPVLSEANLAYRNLGDLKFEEVGASWGLNQKGVSFGAAFGDLDGDGDLDLVYANYQKGVTVLRNDSDSGHRVIIQLRGTRSNRFGIGSTVRIETAAGIQVRPLVLARGLLSSSEPIAHFGLGEETRIKRLTVSWPSGQTQEFTDLDVDRKYTITEPATTGAMPLPDKPKPVSLAQFSEVSEAKDLSFVSRESAIDELVQQPLLPMRQNRRGPALAVGDLN
ncbi:MAG TPA: CRTAC1 family protein, partial [Lacunisphaera sp.]